MKKFFEVLKSVVINTLMYAYLIVYTGLQILGNIFAYMSDGFLKAAKSSIMDDIWKFLKMLK